MVWDFELGNNDWNHRGSYISALFWFVPTPRTTNLHCYDDRYLEGKELLKFCAVFWLLYSKVLFYVVYETTSCLNNKKTVSKEARVTIKIVDYYF